MTTEELAQLGKLIETKQEAEREHTRTMVREEIKTSEERLMKKIADSQEDTIAVLKELIHTGYEMYEERIKRVCQVFCVSSFLVIAGTARQIRPQSG